MTAVDGDYKALIEALESPKDRRHVMQLLSDWCEDHNQSLRAVAWRWLANHPSMSPIYDDLAVYEFYVMVGKWHGGENHSWLPREWWVSNMEEYDCDKREIHGKSVAEAYEKAVAIYDGGSLPD